MDVADGTDHGRLSVRAEHVSRIGTVQVKLALVEQVVPQALKLKRGDPIALFPQHRNHLAEGGDAPLGVPSTLSGLGNELADQSEEFLPVRKAINHELRK